jgi:hypothetical protein
MDRLDQGHLYPLLEVPILICPNGNGTQASVVGGEHSSKELFKQLINSYSEHLHEPATWLPPVHVLHDEHS